MPHTNHHHFAMYAWKDHVCHGLALRIGWIENYQIATLVVHNCNWCPIKMMTGVWGCSHELLFNVKWLFIFFLTVRTSSSWWIPMCCSAILAECPNSVTLIRMTERLHWYSCSGLYRDRATLSIDFENVIQLCQTDHSCQSIRTEGSSQQTYGLSLSMTRSNIALTLFDSFRLWIMWIRYSDGNRTPLIQNLRQIGCIVGLFRNVRRIFCGFPGCFLYDRRVAIDEKEEWKRRKGKTALEDDRRWVEISNENKEDR